MIDLRQERVRHSFILCVLSLSLSLSLSPFSSSIPYVSLWSPPLITSAQGRPTVERRVVERSKGVGQSEYERLWGVALSLHFEVPELGMTYERLLDEIEKEGFTHVSLVTHWSQDDIFSNTIQPHPKETVSDEVLIAVIRGAHQRGMKVLLFPILWIEHREMGQWRGALSPRDPDRWWTQYQQFINHYAQIASQERVEVLSIGSELSSLEGERRRWIQVINSVKEGFKGALIYSANWDHFSEVSFWDHVDYIGMTAYYELTSNPNASTEELERAWRMVRLSLYDWLDRTQVDGRLVFTEVGYPSQVGGAIKPWHYTRSSQVDLEVQRRAFEAFWRVWGDDDRLYGTFFWNWWGLGGSQDTWYTIRGKPALHEVKRFLHSKRDTSSK